jgi:hypothetical protein
MGTVEINQGGAAKYPPPAYRQKLRQPLFKRPTVRGCAAPLIWIKRISRDQIGNASVMMRIDLLFVLSLAWLAVLAGRMLFVIFA